MALPLIALTKPMMAKANVAMENNGMMTQPMTGMMLSMVLPATPTIRRRSPWLAWNRPNPESGQTIRGRKKIR